MRTISINTPGPQGATGPQGVAGPSGSTQPFNNVSGSIWATTSSLQVSGSFLVSGSSTFTNIGPAIFSGSATITGPTTMSSAIVSGDVTVLGTASINVLQISTTINSTGSNILGDAANDTQTLYGTVRIPTGSLTVTGSASVTGIFTHGSASLGAGLITTFDGTYINLTRQGVTTFIGAGSAGNSFIGTNSNQSFSFLTNGIGRAQITAGGNVLIGTTTDSGYALDVNGTARIGGSGGSAQLYIKGLSGTGQYLYFDNGSVANGIWTMVGSTVFAFDSATTRIWRISPSAQMTINGNTNDSSAQFQVESTTRGFLPPRTSATSLISSPAQGLITYVTGSNDGLYYYNNNSQVGWHKVLTNTGSQSITGSLSISGTSILQGAVAINSTNISTGYALFVNGVIGASSLTLTQNLTMGENFAISNNGSQTIDIDANNDTTNAVFRVTANGTANELFRVNETGSFGIGTITPSARLHISGSSNSGLLEIDSPAVNNILYVSGSGNVGIGTTTPTQKLHVSGGNAFVNGTIYFGDGSHYLTTDNSTYALFSSNRNLQLGRSGVAALTVVSTGNVLIGTSTTDAGFKLDVNGNAKIKGSGTTSATTALRVENTNASASMVVLDNGNVGIGTSSPAYLLDITGSDSLINISPQASGNAIVINNNGFIKWENASLDTYLRCSNGFNLSDNGFNSKFNIAFGGLSSINTGQNFSFQSGNVLVGTTTDVGYKLNVSGSVNVSNILTLTPQSPLPSGVATGSFAVSSSVPPKPYFYDGTTWNALY